jgi:hypothetical protein
VPHHEHLHRHGAGNASVSHRGSSYSSSGPRRSEELIG